MAEEQAKNAPREARLLSCYLAADEDLKINSIMLCEMVGNEIHSISLRVAADAMGQRNLADDTFHA